MNLLSTRCLNIALFLLCSCLLFLPERASAGAHSNADPFSVLTVEFYRTKILTTGALSLYKYVTEGPAVPFQEGYAPDTAQQTEWFLLKEDTAQKVQVTRYNYKPVLKLMLADRPDLIHKLGGKGYRFQDIQSIVEEYNRE